MSIGPGFFRLWPISRFTVLLRLLTPTSCTTLDPYKTGVVGYFLSVTYQKSTCTHLRILSCEEYTEKMEATEAQVAVVVQLLQEGRSQRSVAAEVNLSQSTVCKVYQRFQQTAAFTARPRSGRRRCTSERDDRFIVSMALRNRHQTGVTIQQRLREVRGVVASEWTVRRRLKVANLTPRRPATGPRLLPRHLTARKEFARIHKNWTLDQWTPILFSDECRMCLNGCDRRERVYRRPEERYAQCCISERVAYGGGSVMFWGGISYDARTELVFVPSGGRGGGLTAARYITEILEDHVVPYAGMFDEGFMLMQDNAPCHTARVTAAYLREVGIHTMVWPAMSPDLNPIEHMWDRLKRNVRARNPAPATVDELKIALLEEWEAIPQNYIRKLIKSMKNRLRCVSRARGSNTRY